MSVYSVGLTGAGFLSFHILPYSVGVQEVGLGTEEDSAASAKAFLEGLVSKSDRVWVVPAVNGYKGDFWSIRKEVICQVVEAMDRQDYLNDYVMNPLIEYAVANKGSGWGYIDSFYNPGKASTYREARVTERLQQAFQQVSAGGDGSHMSFAVPIFASSHFIAGFLELESHGGSSSSGGNGGSGSSSSGGSTVRGKFNVYDSFPTTYQPTREKAVALFEAFQSKLQDVAEWEFAIYNLDQQNDPEIGDSREWSCGYHTTANILTAVQSGRPPTRRDADRLAYDKQRLANYRVVVVAMANMLKNHAKSGAVTVDGDDDEV